MEYRLFGRSGLTVPAIGMGTWQTFDVRGDHEVAARTAIVDAALAAGTTLFDTSPMYGESERVLAIALGERRDEGIIADKVWTSSAREARQQIRYALEWFGGRVEIYMIQHVALGCAVGGVVRDLPLAEQLGLGVLVMKPPRRQRARSPAATCVRSGTAGALRRAHVGAGTAQVDPERPTLPLRDSGDVEEGTGDRERGGRGAAVV